MDHAVAAAARELLAEVGYGRVTVDAVAARAGVGKAAIYRRYATKQEMLFAAVVHDAPVAAPPDTGSLRGDLTALAHVIVGQLADPAGSSVVLNLMAEASSNPGLVERFSPAFIDSQRTVITLLVERAVHRGELAELPDLDLLHALLGGTALSWLHILRHDPHDLPDKLAGLACAALGHA
ncbi:TetR/AcrR family transcriptional regulator [Streptomyces sp. AN091965]|uniref:TetR/AcrR family transcriptional regulator n=1 Tax=Streptomyces sp. AN091965 TaxID=2927803 RepID=UPI001F6257E0|nr:TetR/AcrR family transcriptional regulator [Streptomyces sp. AN091965]MCI3928362.1 TetR/AcrR family transcriptional regulator [Streptomyces sp. AN091965]